ncbi:PspA/IM30 family protein [Chungangia koreensis]|uniref:PspA/IM30 family protein n=1 Tax=Chungangia koreensis TaxID=752657 RepID=A0ABV8X5K2_9LACT
MTTLWNRFKYSVEADLHSLFDKKEKKNPIAMLNQYIREAEKQTGETGKLLERQGQLKKELEKEYTAANEMLAKRLKQLELAQASGENDLVFFAEQEVTAYSQRTEVLSESIRNAGEELFQLERKFEEMKHKVKDMKVRQLQLMGKENVVRANHRMDRVLTPEASEQAEKRLGTFNEMEEYIEKLGKQIDKEHEISNMERRLESLEKVEEKKSEIV